MHTGMLEKLGYNFGQKYVQFLDTNSNIEQKDFEKQLPFISDFLSQLFALIWSNRKIHNTIPNPFSSQEFFGKFRFQFEANYFPETVNINNFSIGKIIDSSKVDTITSNLERELLSNHSALINQLEFRNSPEEESSNTDLVNGLLKIARSNLQEDVTLIKFNYSSKSDNIGNLLPDYLQSINQLSSKFISKQNQTKNTKIKMQINNIFECINQRPSETELSLYETANRFVDLSKQSLRSSKVNNSSNLGQDDTVQFISKQPSNVEPNKIENDKTFEAMNKVKEDAISQKYKNLQTDERIFDSPTGNETKNWEFQSQFIKNQSLTKLAVENSHNLVSEFPTTFRLLSRFYEIPSKIASIINSQVEVPARAEIHLQPLSLGMVVIVITASRNSVDITMQVKNKETWKALETQFAPLREKLTQLGFENTNIDLQLSQEANSQMQNQSENKTNDYLLRQNFLRSFSQLRRNEVRDFQEFVSHIMGVS